MGWLWQGGKFPTNMPDRVYHYLVVTLRANPEHVSQLKCAEQVSYVGGVVVNLIRIFDPREAEKTAKIKDFTSLDQHPELIVYEGYVEKESGHIHIEPGRRAQRGQGESKRSKEQGIR
jgi:hypothetical protein